MHGKSHKIEKTAGACLDDDSLYRYLEKLATEEESHRVERHLNSCTTCFRDFAALARSAYTPATEAEKIELASLPKLPPQEQVEKILDYIETECGPNTPEADFFAFLQKMWEKVKIFTVKMISPPNQLWKPAVALASIIVLYVGIVRPIYNSNQSNSLADSGLSFLVANYYLPKDVPRPQGGFKYDVFDFGQTRSGERRIRGEDLRRYELAKKDLQKALAFNNKNAAAHHYLGTYYLLVEMNFDRAREQYRLVLAQDSTNASILNDLGVLAWHEGALDEAAKKFSLALKYVPDFLEAQYNMATLYQEQGKVGEAMTEWKKYLALDQDSDWAKIARSYAGQ